MVLKVKNAVIPVMGIALTFQAVGCKKDKDSNTDLLVGEWNVVKVDGVAPDEKSTFKFESDQDFTTCYDDAGSTYCYDGNWAWLGSDEDEVNMTWNDGSDTYVANLQIDKLTKDELEGDFTSDGATYRLELEKL